jgi:transposase
MVSGIYYILRTGVPWRDLPGGNRHDLKAIAPIVGTMSGCHAVGDRGFDSKILRGNLTALKAAPCIPPRKTSKIDYAFSKVLYAQRQVVENFFGWIKRPRRLGTRYEKLGETFLGFVTFATVLDWLRFEV